MELIRRTPSVVPQMMRMMDDFMNTEFADWSRSNHSRTGATIPAVNVRENEEAIEVEMAAPGLARENFKVELDNNLLTISSHGEEENQEKEENGRYTRREFSYGDFQRSFRLPANVVDIEHIEARYTDGLLWIRIPKREEARKMAPRLIEIE